jgi:hypothetical protein
MMCTDAIDFETLIACWLGELPAGREAMLETHLFGCAHCTTRLESLAALAAGVRAAVFDGRVSLVASLRFAEAMRQAGLCLREYRLEPGGSVNCTIREDDDAVVSRLCAPLAGVKRMDVVSLIGSDGSAVRLSDVPFDAETGEVIILPSAAWLKTMPAFTMHMRLISVGDAGERQIGDYTFNHAPSCG